MRFSQLVPREADLRRDGRPVRRCRYCGNIVYSLDRCKRTGNGPGVRSGVCSRPECKAAFAATKPLQSSSRSGN